jgi:autotransporter-associated beta strand protein
MKRTDRERVIVAAAAAGSMLWTAAAPAANFSDGGRWTATAVDGSGKQRGDPLTLQWSIIPDGTPTWDLNQGSNLVGHMDALYGAGPGGSDLTQRPWFGYYARIFTLLTNQTGLTCVYVPDDGARLGGNPTPPGVVGVRGDIRIGGRPTGIPALAWAAFPNQGDIEMNTGWSGWNSPGAIYNVFSHEVGHTLGLGHLDIPNHNALIEAGGKPGYDDLYALHRLYGDPMEKAGGNDSASTARALGNLSQVGSRAVGTSISSANLEVALDATDFASIDGTSDQDWFRFSVDRRGGVNLSVTPVGPSYTFTPENGSATSHVGTQQSNLQLELYDAAGARQVIALDRGGLGAAETLQQFRLAAGDYFVRVRGTEDRNQFYRLDVAAVAVSATAHDWQVFQDRFDVADTADLDASRLTNPRQGRSLADSPWRSSTSGTAGNASVSIEGNRLKLRSVNGGGTANGAAAATLRNFASDVKGKRWSVMLDLETVADAGQGDGWFGFSLADTASLGGPSSGGDELSLLIRHGGAFQIWENGATRATGSAGGNVHTLTLRIDETGTTPLVDVLINGVVRLNGEPIAFAQDGRYVGLRSHAGTTGAAGLAFTAFVDALRIELEPQGVATFNVPTGNWAGSSNWLAGNLPGASTDVLVGGGRTASISSAVPPVGGNLFVGTGDGNGTLVVAAGGSITATGALLLGYDAGRVGTYTQSGGVASFAAMVVGDEGGATDGGASSATVSGGTLAVGSLFVAVGDSGTTSGSSFSASGGTVTVNGDVVLGEHANAATLSVTGSALVRVAGSIGEGITGGATSTLVLDGGTLDLAADGSAGAIAVDNLQLRTGTLRNVQQLNGGATLVKNTPGTLTIAGANAFTSPLSVSSGTLHVAGSTATGGTSTVSGAGVLRVTHAAALGTANVNLSVANADTGRLEVGGGVSILSGRRITLAGRNNDTPAILATDGVNTIAAAIDLSPGGGSYVVESSSGAALTLSGVVSNPTTSGRMLTLRGDGNGTISGAINNGANAGAVVGLTKAGAGDWRLTPGNGTYSGGTTVSAGRLLAMNPTGSATGSGPVSVAGGTLGGNGRITGAVTVAPAGTLAPGDGVGTLRLAGGLTMQAGSTLALELASASSFDRVEGEASSLALATSLQVSLLGGFVPAVTDTFAIASASSLAASVGNLNPLGRLDAAGGGSFRVSVTATQLVLGNYLAALLTGDVNLDGRVNNQDIAPFVSLLTGGTSPADVRFVADANLDGVVNNQDIAPFVALLTGGRPLADVAGDPQFAPLVSVVPEPASLSLLALAGMAMARRRRRRLSP